MKGHEAGDAQIWELNDRATVQRGTAQCKFCKQRIHATIAADAPEGQPFNWYTEQFPNDIAPERVCHAR